MQPKISVIITAYNEEKLLPACLESLKKQSYPKDLYEVIVVDNGSKDRTATIAKKFGDKVYTYTELQGTGASRVFGAQKAKGSILAFTDADVTVPPDWLEKIATYMDTPGIVCISGRPESLRKHLGLQAILLFYHFSLMFNHVIGKPLVWGFNMVVKREAYTAVGGIDKNLLSAEDWDLSFQLQKHFGTKSIRYIPDLFVYTSGRKETNLKTYIHYAFDGVQNYLNFVVLKKKKLKPLFNVR